MTLVLHSFTGHLARNGRIPLNQRWIKIFPGAPFLGHSRTTQHKNSTSSPVPSIWFYFFLTALAGGDPDRSLRLAQKLLKSVEGITKEDLANKVEVIANINSCIGNAYIELEQFQKALRYHEKDLNLSKEWAKER